MPTVVTITVDGEPAGCPTSSPTLADVMAKLNQLQEQITMNHAETAAALTAVGDRLTEASTEIVARLQDLQAAITEAGNTTPEVDAALARVQTLAAALADIVPNDPPADPPPAEEPADPPAEPPAP